MKTNDNISDYNQGCIPSDILLKYIKGELLGMERNRIERHLATCEMCSDELEGLSIVENPEMIDEISLELNQQIDDFTTTPKKELPSLDLYFRIAAGIAMLFGASTIIYFTAFHKTSSLMPSYALMENENLKSALDSSKEQMLRSVAGDEKKENKELAVRQEGKKKYIMSSNPKVVEPIVRYVAPAMVDSVVSDDALAEVSNEEVIDSDIVNEQNVAELNQVAAEYIIQPAPASSEKKSVLASSRLAVEGFASSADKSKDMFVISTYNAKKQTAINLFSNRQYRDALALLQAINNDFPDKDTIGFYSSLCNYHLNRFDETISQIAEFAKNPQSELYSKAKWYYALALIGADRKEEAIAILKQIMQDDSTHKDEARRELEKLKGN